MKYQKKNSEEITQITADVKNAISEKLRKGFPVLSCAIAGKGYIELKYSHPEKYILEYQNKPIKIFFSLSLAVEEYYNEEEKLQMNYY
jgi:hypothetical protein